MNEATVIYPHQLIKNHPGLAQGRPIYLVEEPLLLTYNPIHRQKLLFHLDTLDYYEQYLLKKGYVVHRLLIKNYHSTSDIFNKIKRH